LDAHVVNNGRLRSATLSQRSFPVFVSESSMHLFDRVTFGNVALRNRIVVSPMCEYSAVDGVPLDWHFVHLGSRAVGGAGLVFTEATAVSPEGRISLGDTGIWNDAQRDAWARIAAFVAAQGAMPGMQLAHAGRKASTATPWNGGRALTKEQGAWTPVAPSAIAFTDEHAVPIALDATGIAKVVAEFRAAAVRAKEAGFRVLELHAAHGYLLHEFLSPLSNSRTDEYGGSLAHRARLLREVVAAVRSAWPAPAPLFVRVSATDWVAGGWDIDECVELARWLKEDGVDLIDCSSGGTAARANVPSAPGYQVPFAARIRRESGIATGAVGLITEARQAEAILDRGDADLIIMAREMLRDPYFPRRAAKELGATIETPVQYQRAW
jgi:2,4-dienoyl-CoA reductase-like NADH-dependent reductase (Old Yellow Enzyme family)